MTDKLFSLYKRGKYFYCQFKQADGTYGPARSTKATTKGKAEAWAIDCLRSGDVVVRKKQTLSEFSVGFFDFEGEWAKDKRITGRRISPRNCNEKQRLFDAKIIPEIGDMALGDINRHTIKELRNRLFYEQEMSGSSVNKVLSSLRSVLEAADDKGMIQSVPRFDRVNQRPEREKGILTIEEARRVLAVEWDDPRAQIMSLVASSTGMRQGELLGMKVKNYKRHYLEVSQSWNERMRELNATTKTGRGRTVIIPEKVSKAIEWLFDINPWIPTLEEEAFIFFSWNHDWRPTDGKYMTECLYRAIVKAGISEEERKARNITFHSWRYFLNSLLINAKIPLQKIQSITGHLTDEMSQHYYTMTLGDMSDVRAIQERMFGDEGTGEGTRSKEDPEKEIDGWPGKALLCKRDE